MVDELSANIIAELRKIGTFGGFSGERMQSLLERIWNKVDYALKDSQKLVGHIEECSNSKVMQIGLNGRTFKYHFWRERFHMLPQSYTFSHRLCFNNFLQV